MTLRRSRDDSLPDQTGYFWSQVLMQVLRHAASCRSLSPPAHGGLLQFLPSAACVTAAHGSMAQPPPLPFQCCISAAPPNKAADGSRRDADLLCAIEVSCQGLVPPPMSLTRALAELISGCVAGHAVPAHTAAPEIAVSCAEAAAARVWPWWPKQDAVLLLRLPPAARRPPAPPLPVFDPPVVSMPCPPVRLCGGRTASAGTPLFAAAIELPRLPRPRLRHASRCRWAVCLQNGRLTRRLAIRPYCQQAGRSACGPLALPAGRPQAASSCSCGRSMSSDGGIGARCSLTACGGS